MKPFDIAIACISLIVILLGLFYKKLKSSIINETLLSMLFGIALSPAILNVLEMESWTDRNNFMEKACRLTLAMALMSTALRIPKNYFINHKKVQVTFLLLIMPAMFLMSSAIIHFIAGFNWNLSLLAGAIITPTDPVLAGTILTGEKAKELLPQKVRDAISFESGANDGLAFPFVMLGLLLINNEDGIWTEWLTKTWLWETAGAIIIGLALGYIFGQLLEYCIKKKYTAKPAVLAYALSVSFFVLTALELIGVNGVLAVFIAGLMMKQSLGRQEDIEEEEIQEMMARLFTIPIFIFLGLILPLQQWVEMGWNAVLVALLVILLRRLPFVWFSKGLLKPFQNKDLLFMGWFGPIGAAALFYSFYSYKILEIEEIWTVVSLVVFTSVVVHGVTAYPFLKWYGKKNGNEKQLK